MGEESKPTIWCTAEKKALFHSSLKHGICWHMEREIKKSELIDRESQDFNKEYTNISADT